MREVFLDVLLILVLASSGLFYEAWICRRKFLRKMRVVCLCIGTGFLFGIAIILVGVIGVMISEGVLRSFLSILLDVLFAGIMVCLAVSCIMAMWFVLSSSSKKNIEARRLELKSLSPRERRKFKIEVGIGFIPLILAGVLLLLLFGRAPGGAASDITAGALLLWGGIKIIIIGLWKEGQGSGLHI